jgi:hypothetical protein
MDLLVSKSEPLWCDWGSLALLLPRAAIAKLSALTLFGFTAAFFLCFFLCHK